MLPSHRRTPINVSGFENNCGLFALTLGVKLALATIPHWPSTIPATIKGIREDSLERTTADTSSISVFLRNELYEALLNDADHKSKRENSFLQLCSGHIDNKSHAVDMESFERSSKKFLDDVKNEWAQIEKQIQESKPDINEILRQIKEAKIEEQLIVECHNEFIQQLKTDRPYLVSDLGGKFFQSEAESVVKIIKQEKLFKAAWERINNEDASEKRRQEFPENFIESCNKNYLLELKRCSDVEEFCGKLFMFSVLHDASFKKDGDLNQNSSPDILATKIKDLFILFKVRENWDQIYRDYCNYIKEQPVRISGDELSPLACKWGVQFDIKFSDGQTFQSYTALNPSLPRIVLCNHSFDHWQVADFSAPVSSNPGNNDSNVNSSRVENYNRPPLVPAGLTGISYQIKILMLYAFDAYANGQQFELMSEMREYEKFDDLVLLTWNPEEQATPKNQVLKVLQAKHCYEPEGRYKLEHLLAETEADESKKAALSLYFDSWCGIEARKKEIPNKYPDKIQYIFYTNHAVPTELEGCIENNKYTEEFIAGKVDDKKLEVRRRLIDSIYQNSTIFKTEKAQATKTIEFDISKYDSEIKLAIVEQVKKLVEQVEKLGCSNKRKRDLEIELGEDNKTLIWVLRGVLIPSKKGVYQFSPTYLENKNLGEYHQIIRDKLTAAKFNLTEMLFRIKKQLFELPSEAVQGEQGRGKSYLTLLPILLASSELKHQSSIASFTLCKGGESLVQDTPKNYAIWFAGAYGSKLFKVNLEEKTEPLYEYQEKIQQGLQQHRNFKSNTFTNSDGLEPRVKTFLEQFEFQTDQPNEKELTTLLENKIDGQFHIKEQDFYLRFYVYMLNELTQMQAKPINERNFDELFKTAHTELRRQHLTGHSDRFIYHLKDKFRYSIPLLSSSWTIIENFLNRQDKQILILHSKNRHAAALSLCQFFENRNYAQGIWAFFDSKYGVLSEDPQTFQSEPFFVMAIDRAEFLFQRDEGLLVQFATQVTTHKKKLILLCQSGEQLGIENSIMKSGFQSNSETDESKDAGFNIDEVKKILTDNGCLKKYVRLGHNYIQLEQVLQIPHTGLYAALTDPVLLREILNAAINTPSGPENTQSMVEKRGNIFIKPTIQQLFPVYSLEDLIRADHSFFVVYKGEKEGNAKLNSDLVIDIDLEKLNVISQSGNFSKWDDLIKAYCKQYESTKQDFKNYQDWLVVLANVSCFSKLASHLQTLLSEHKHYLILDEKERPVFLASTINIEAVKEGGGGFFKLFDLNDFSKMPSAKKYTKGIDYRDSDYKQLLIRQPYGQRRVLVSSYGSGKSKLLAQLDKDFKEDMIKLANDIYIWTFTFSFNKLELADNGLSLYELINKHHYPNGLQKYEDYCLNYDIKHGNSLFLLDGWDEMKESQRQQCRDTLKELFNYPNIIVTSRPNDEATIPVNATEHLRLSPFDDIQIGEFINEYFDGSSLALKEKALAFLEQCKNRKRLILLGKPLLCRIVCDIIESGSIISGNEEFFLSTLFQKLVESNLRKYHQDHNHIPTRRLEAKRVYHLSQPQLERMCVVALSHIFNKPTQLELDSILDEDLACIALMKPVHQTPVATSLGYEFEHQTIAEYFSSLQIVKQLLDRQEQENIINSLQHNLYNTRYQVVWQFISSIVTVGDVLVPHAQKACFLFFNLWYKAEKDLVGLVQQSLLSICLSNANFSIIEQSIKNEGLLSEMQDKFLNFFKQYQQDAQILREHTTENERHGGVSKISSPEVTDEKDIEIERSARYERGILEKSTLVTLPEEARIEGLTTVQLHKELKICVDILLVTLQKFKNKNESLDNQVTTIYKLALFAKKLDKSTDSGLINKIIEILMNYFLEPQSLNGYAYQAAYWSICELLDSGMIFLTEGLAERLSTNFDQKAVVCDLVQRLKNEGFMSDMRIKRLCQFNRYDRNGFWDYNAGIPAMLYLKDRLNEDIAQFLVRNITERSSGDFEFGKTYEVLKRLSKLHYVNEGHIDAFLTILTKLTNLADVNSDGSDYQIIYQNVLLHFSREQLIGSAWKRYCYVSEYSDVHQCKQKYFILKLLFDIAVQYRLAIVMKDGELKWSSDLIDPLKIPEDQRDLQFIRYHFALFQNRLIDARKLFIAKKYPQVTLDVYKADFYDYLKDVSKFSYGANDEIRENFSFELCLIAIDMLSQHKFRREILTRKNNEQDCQKFFDKMMQKMRNENNCDASALSNCLELLPQNYSYQMDDSALSFFTDKLNSGSKDDVPCCIAFLVSAKAPTAVFDSFFNRNENNSENFWRIDAGIPGMARLFSRFSEKAYNYLRSYVSHTYYQTVSSLQKAIEYLSQRKLTEREPILYFTKLLLAMDLDEDELFTNLLKNIKNNFDLSILGDLAQELSKEPEYNGNQGLKKIIAICPLPNKKRKTVSQAVDDSDLSRDEKRLKAPSKDDFEISYTSSSVMANPLGQNSLAEKQGIFKLKAKLPNQEQIQLNYALAESMALATTHNVDDDGVEQEEGTENIKVASATVSHMTK